MGTLNTAEHETTPYIRPIREVFLFVLVMMGFLEPNVAGGLSEIGQMSEAKWSRGRGN